MDHYLFDAQEVFQAAVWMDDGREPIAGCGGNHDFTTAAQATEWGLDRVRTKEAEQPVPRDAPGWYMILTKGHYERTGETGFDAFDCDWIEEEIISGPVFTT